MGASGRPRERGEEDDGGQTRGAQAERNPKALAGPQPRERYSGEGEQQDLGDRAGRVRA